MGRYADLVLWTSAQESYTSALVDELDPTGNRFLAVLTREACTDLQDGSYAKDLSILGRPLERTLLLDDCAPSFLFQPDNAIPIQPFFGDKDDRALPLIMPLLRGLELVTDVRDNLRTTYKTREHLQKKLQEMRGS
jgi:TFIIF-interacting CTD phosphatase-like protein